MKDVDRRPVVVSLTPLPLSADSRTLKQVTSVHRFGFKSIVIEGAPSRLADEAIPFEIISIGARAQPQTSTDAAPVASEAVAVPHPEAEEKLAAAAPDPVVIQDIKSLSILQRWPVGRLALRIPGLRRVARALQRNLLRALVSLKGGKQLQQRPSIAQIIFALPYAMILLAREVVGWLPTRILPPGISQSLRAAAINPLAFANYLATYLDQHVFKVLSVTPRADLYYLHSFYQFPAVFLLCLRYRARMIYDAHDFYQHQKEDPTVSSYWKKWVIPFEGAIEAACIRFASDVVTVNEGIAALMRERFRCEPVILRNAHDFRLDRQVPRTIRDAIGLAPEAFLVVFIGNYKSGMTLEGAFDALVSLPKHVHLAFLGGRYPDCNDALATRGLEGRVHFVPPVLPQEIVPVAASADVAVLLYFKRTIQYPNILPNGFFQSVAAGLPLVYPDLEQIRRVAERHKLGIMANAQDANEIRSALQLLVENDEVRETFRENVRVSRQELCWAYEERTLEPLLNRHLSKSAPNVSRIEDKVAH
ncbi:glycosyltransferase [Bradyrhizobium sp. BR 1433]|uniref:glycosyltransferase n=1 Tax=Bradyrhizobium sp. BR 1433 TaxID=3447967 RepID=UPI003EE70764